MLPTAPSLQVTATKFRIICLKTSKNAYSIIGEKFGKSALVIKFLEFFTLRNVYNVKNNEHQLDKFLNHKSYHWNLSPFSYFFQWTVYKYLERTRIRMKVRQNQNIGNPLSRRVLFLSISLTYTAVCCKIWLFRNSSI